MPIDERRRCGLRKMLSASHNAMPDNGIKFFARGGHKLDDEVERAIGARMGEHWGRHGSGEAKANLVACGVKLQNWVFEREFDEELGGGDRKLRTEPLLELGLFEADHYGFLATTHEELRCQQRGPEDAVVQHAFRIHCWRAYRAKPEMC